MSDWWGDSGIGRVRLRERIAEGMGRIGLLKRVLTETLLAKAVGPVDCRRESERQDFLVQMERDLTARAWPGGLVCRGEVPASSLPGTVGL